MLSPEILAAEDVRKVTICFLDARNAAANGDRDGQGCSSGHCVAETFDLDREGRVVAADFHRLGSFTVYERDADGAITQASWIDKISGERTVIWERGKQPMADLPRFQMGSARAAGGEIVRIFDPCFSVDGVYRIAYELDGALPIRGTAILQEDLLLESKGMQTPVKIHIHFEYVRSGDDERPGSETERASSPAE